MEKRKKLFEEIENAIDTMRNPKQPYWVDHFKYNVKQVVRFLFEENRFVFNEDKWHSQLKGITMCEYGTPATDFIYAAKTAISEYND